MWHLLDVMEYGIRAALLLYLCRDALIWKKKYRKQGKYLFFLLLCICGLWISNSVWLKQLLYGEDMYIRKSSTSVVKVFLMMLLSFLLLEVFCEGRRIVNAYLALLFESIIEMARFGVHGFWSLAIDAYSNWQIEKISDNVRTMDSYLSHMAILGYVWNLTLMFLYFSVTYVTIRAVLKYRQDIQHIGRQGILFLMLSPAVGMAFDVILRCLFFTRTGAAYDFIYDKHRGMYAVIPIMTFLCLLSMVYSTRIYKELMQAQEEKSNMAFYKQQLADMTGHVQEMERLYDSIRGMRHDMNNCIADMEQLFAVSSKKNPDGTEEAEAGRYLYRMKSAMDALTPKCNTGNPVTDVILNRKWQECEKEGIVFTSSFIYPESLKIEAFDLGILLNNALDNAIEACRKCARQQTHISLHSYLKRNMFFLHIENDCDSGSIVYSKQLPQDKTLQTTKDDAWMHGIGIRNMKSVAGRYFGTISYEIHDEVFVLTVMLQGRADAAGINSIG